MIILLSYTKDKTHHTLSISKEYLSYICTRNIWLSKTFECTPIKCFVTYEFTTTYCGCLGIFLALPRHFHVCQHMQKDFSVQGLLPPPQFKSYSETSQNIINVTQLRIQLLTRWNINQSQYHFKIKLYYKQIVFLCQIII